MSISEKTSEPKASVRLPRPGEITLLAMIALGFLLLHVLAGVLLLPNSSGLIAPQEQASVSSTD
jgi:hypothetical protein